MNWERYKPYFSEKEFQDNKGKCWMKERHMNLLLKARIIADVPFVVTSGCRNPSQNKEVGGKETSEHLTGEGCDVAASSSRIRFKIIEAAVLVGFTRIGIGKDFIHLGSSEDKDQEVAWLY